MLDRRLAEAIEDGQLAQSIAVEDCDRAMRCNLDATLGSVFLFAGRYAEGVALLEGSIARAAEWGFEGQTSRGYRMIGSSGSVLVDYDNATRWLRAGMAYAERVEQFSDHYYMAAHLGHVQWATGEWSRAVDTVSRALADSGGITTRITALHVLGFVALGRGAFTDASAYLTEAAALGEGMRELQRTSPAWWGLAETALLSGSFDEAIGWCEKGYAASARVRDAAYLFPYVVTGVRAHLGRSGATAAREWLERTSAVLKDRGIPGTLGAVEHGWGLVHLHEGQTGKARVALAAAEEFWRARRRFWEGAAARVDRSRCAARSRRAGEAEVLLAAARREYGAVGAAVPGLLLGPSSSGGFSPAVPTGLPRVREASPSEASPSSPPPPVRASRTAGSGSPGVPGARPVAASSLMAAAGPPRGTAGSGSAVTVLSAREMEVARLIAEGMTNREIAAALTIAPKTAAAHVEHIRTKLGFSRRAQVAAWVVALR
jgi:DNA-binding CsgD family transcriptional regulator